MFLESYSIKINDEKVHHLQCTTPGTQFWSLFMKTIIRK